MHLLRVSGALVLIDGYNVAKWRWPGAAPIDLRERLLDVLADLARRYGTQFHVVFDGIDPTGSGVGVVRKVIRVSFSPEGREADDVLLDLVQAQPNQRSVAVVSSDRRVQDGAQSLGANVISSSAFVSLWSMHGSK